MRPSIPETMSPFLIEKWRALAERRRAHFVDLYETGRWRRYYSEMEFLRTARAAFDLADHWTRLACAGIQERDKAA